MAKIDCKCGCGELTTAFSGLKRGHELPPPPATYEMELLPDQQIAMDYMSTVLAEGGRPKICWAGGVRSGKSKGACKLLVEHSELADEPLNYILGGAVMRTTINNLFPPLRDVCRDLGVSYKPNRSTNDPHVLVGGKHRFLVYGGDDVDSQEKVQGLTAAGMLMDELSALDFDFVRQSRARLSLKGAIAIYTFNKMDYLHWSAEFYENAKKNDDFLVLESETADNYFLDAGYIDDMEDDPLAMNDFVPKGRLLFPNWFSAPCGNPVRHAVYKSITGEMACLVIDEHGVVIDDNAPVDGFNIPTTRHREGSHDRLVMNTQRKLETGKVMIGENCIELKLHLSSYEEKHHKRNISTPMLEALHLLCAGRRA